MCLARDDEDDNGMSETARAKAGTTTLSAKAGRLGASGLATAV